MHTKFLNRLVYEHLLGVNKRLARAFKREANVAEKLPPTGSTEMIDIVKYFKETASKERSQKLVESENYIKLVNLLRDSNIKGLQNSKISKIVTMISDEIGLDNLQTISESDFLQKAKTFIKNDLHNSNPFCWYCLKTFKHRMNRNLHVQVMHEKKKDKTYRCELCKKTFMSKTAQIYHRGVSHSKSRPKVECEVCGEILSHLVSLQRHMKKHETVPKEFQCPECDKSFKRKDSLQRHIRIVHRLFTFKVGLVNTFKDGENQFKCKSCAKVFQGPNGENNFVKHLTERCKSNERFKCDICHKDFSRSATLDQHREATHNDANRESTYSCTSCSFLTKYKSSLDRHIKRLHEKE